jgi:hypothetical protein
MRALGLKIRRICEKTATSMKKAHRGVKWAFYKQENFVAFIAHVGTALDELEKLCPPERRRAHQQLSRRVCEDERLSAEELAQLADIAGGCDGVIEAAARDVLVSVNTVSNTINMSTVYGVQLS